MVAGRDSRFGGLLATGFLFHSGWAWRFLRSACFGNLGRVLRNVLMGHHVAWQVGGEDFHCQSGRLYDFAFVR